MRMLAGNLIGLTLHRVVMKTHLHTQILLWVFAMMPGSHFLTLHTSYNKSGILYLLNLYITKIAKPISMTDTSMMTAVPLRLLSLLSIRGALKEKECRCQVHVQAK